MMLWRDLVNVNTRLMVLFCFVFSHRRRRLLILVHHHLQPSPPVAAKREAVREGKRRKQAQVLFLSKNAISELLFLYLSTVICHLLSYLDSQNAFL